MFEIDTAMFEGDFGVIALAVLGALALGGIAFVILDPLLSGERKMHKRRKNLTDRVSNKARISAQETASNRRKNIQDSLKELEKQSRKKKKLTLKTSIERAGLEISQTQFWILSLIVGLANGVFVFMAGGPIYLAVIAVFAIGLGLPRWILKFLRKRRQTKFIEEFANSLDVVVRGVKTGLPVNDCFQMIASEAAEPVRSEFKLVVEAQRLGVPLEEGLERMYDRMPLAEVSFLAIVMAIQKESGGNLSEALGNLSKVLRERKKMKGKITAMSQEAKSSAAIIGSLPILVMGIVYISTPEYITLLWTDPTGQVMLGASAFWMTCGVLVMKKMINFDF